MEYGIFIPTTTNITEVETAALFFKHVISKFGFLGKLFWIEILGGVENFGRKFAIEWA